MHLDPKQLIARIIYSGVTVDRGRCYGTIWKIGYHNALKKHIDILFNFSYMLYNDNYNSFIPEVKRLQQLRKNQFYQNTYSYICEFSAINLSADCCLKYNTNPTPEYKMIDEIIFILLSELKKEIGRFRPRKKQLYTLLNAIHNLPRVYFNKHTKTSHSNELYAISVPDAINYFSLDLNLKLRNLMKKKMQKESYAILQQLQIK